MSEVIKVALRLTGMDMVPIIYTNKLVGLVKAGSIITLKMEDIENGDKKQKGLIRKYLFEEKKGFLSKPKIKEKIEISVFLETGGLCDTTTNIDYQGFNAVLKIEN